MTIGILGAGQLGRMLALAGYRLGLRFLFLDPAADAPASHLAPCLAGDYDNNKLLASLAERSDVVTYEFENVPVASARRIAAATRIFPPPEALATGQDRLAEKQLFAALDIPTPPYEAVATRDELAAALARVGLPAILKSRRHGYDGKGQCRIIDAADADLAWQAIGQVPALLEALVPFERELSVLAVRGLHGQTAFYPLIENHHSGGILRLSLAPAPNLDDALTAQAQRHAQALLDHLNYVGVLAIEFFQHDGRLLANEMAPRVHNSGHWTMNGAQTCQFENHLRAGLGLPLGSTEAVGSSAMLNLIGQLPDIDPLLQLRNTHLHLYGKEPRPGRKLGHINVTASSSDERAAAVGRLDKLLRSC